MSGNALTTGAGAKMPSSRAQSAVEYLATYGWSILIVVIVISFIFIYVSGTSSAVPSSCLFNNGLTCTDIAFSSGSSQSTFALIAVNSQKYPISNPTLILNPGGQGNVTGTCSPPFVAPGGTMLCTATILTAFGQGEQIQTKLFIQATTCPSGNSAATCSGGALQSYSGTSSAHIQPLFSSTPFSISLSATNITQTANGQSDLLTATVYLLGEPFEGATVNFTDNETFPAISPGKTNTNFNGHAQSYIASSTPGNVTVYANFSGYSSNIVLHFVPALAVTFEAANTLGVTGTVLTVDNVQYTASQLPLVVPLSSRTRTSYSYPSSVTGNGVMISGATVSGCGQNSDSGYITANYNCTIIATYSTQQYLLTMSANPSAAGVTYPGTAWETHGALVPISTTTNSPGGGSYMFTSWSGTGSGSTSSTSNSASVTMNGPITEIAEYVFEGPLTVSPPMPTTNTVYPGNTAYITDNGATGGTPPYHYQWLATSAGGSTFNSINGNNLCGSSAQTSECAFPTSRSTTAGNYMFELQVTDSESPAVTANSAAATVDVLSTAPVSYCTSAINSGSSTLTANSGCSLYFCAGANYNYAMTYSWSSDAVTSPAYSASGNQTSDTCTVTSSGASNQGLGVIGFNGITSGGYLIINTPTTFNGLGSSFSSTYSIGSASNVVILVGCGWYTCTAITFPSGCTTEVSNVGTGSIGTIAIAYCQSQSANTYTISGTASGSAYISVEAALLSGGVAPTLTFSNGNQLYHGTSDNAIGTTIATGHTVEIESCNGISCGTPNNVLATGTNTVAYNLNVLAVGNYIFDACDTTSSACSPTRAVRVAPQPTPVYCTSTGNVGSNTLTAASGCSVYFCAGGNRVETLTPYSWSSDVAANPGYALAASGNQTSDSCTVTIGSYLNQQALGVIGFNGIISGGYSIINTPNVINNRPSFFSGYALTQTSNVVILVACGSEPCPSITFPSGCTTKVSQNVFTNYNGTVAIAYCQSQPSGSYAISGSSPEAEGLLTFSAYIAVEVALLSGSGSPAPIITFSNSNQLVEGTLDIAIGNAIAAGDGIQIEDCSGTSCTPNNVLTTGTTGITYGLNGLAAGNYVFDACDTAKSVCSATHVITVLTQPIVTYCTSSGNTGSNTLTANSGCSVYFCAGGNVNSQTYSWSNDASEGAAASGNQTSSTCSAYSGTSVAQALGVIGFNGIYSGGYWIINSPKTYSYKPNSTSFSSSYYLSSTSNVVDLFACSGNSGSSCSTVTFPSGCTTKVTENVGGSEYGSAAIAYCQSQPAGTYTITATIPNTLDTWGITFEAALLSGSGGTLPTLTFSNGNSMFQGATNNAMGTATNTGDTVEIEDCSGTSCTPNNVLATGTNTVAYTLNGLAVGNYIFQVYDTNTGVNSLKTSVVIYPPLVLTSNTLLGMTVYGGSTNNGTVFSYNDISNTLTLVHAFTGWQSADGEQPQSGNITISGTTLYGMTFFGGYCEDCGVIFSYNTLSNTYSNLHSFDFVSGDGSQPDASLLLSGTTLYGTTTNGGSSSLGTIFAFNTISDTETVLYSFVGGSSDGQGPSGSLTLIGNTLYGMTSGGGPDSDGTIFAFNTISNTETILHDFAGGSSDGAQPQSGASLIASGRILYGMALGGTGNDGVIFSYNTISNTETILHYFVGGSSDGAQPHGSLTLIGNTLYGMTFSGGTDDYGVIFSYNTISNTETILHSFAGSPNDGQYPEASFTPLGTTLYGMAYGGTYGDGIIFSFNTASNTITILHDFTSGSSDGNGPLGSLSIP